MDQKRFNERIAMSLLRQCAWVWEHCTANPHEGEFRLQDVLQGIGKNGYKSKTGTVIVDTDLCKYWDVFNVSQPIDGLDFDREEMTSRMSFVTDAGLGLGFSFSFPIGSVFRVTSDFCQTNACQALMTKTVFFRHGEERWASLPEVKLSSYRPEKPHTIRRTTKAAVTRQHTQAVTLSLADRLRAALLERLAA